MIALRMTQLYHRISQAAEEIQPDSQARSYHSFDQLDV